ncbi:MAG: hypothetical protein ABL971_03000 [Vicinamibacterales bacterium]
MPTNVCRPISTIRLNTNTGTSVQALTRDALANSINKAVSNATWKALNTRK